MKKNMQISIIIEEEECPIDINYQIVGKSLFIDNLAIFNDSPITLEEVSERNKEEIIISFVKKFNEVSNLKDRIKGEINVVKEMMIQRARMYAESFIVDDLFELTIPISSPAMLYSREDSENHEYDLARLKTLEEVLTWI